VSWLNTAYLSKVWYLAKQRGKFTFTRLEGTRDLQISTAETSHSRFLIGYRNQWSTVRRYEGVSKSFRTGRLERELQMVQLSATRCSCMAILWVCLVSFAAITLCVVSQRVFIVVSVYFVIDSVRKLLHTPSYLCVCVGGGGAYTTVHEHRFCLSANSYHPLSLQVPFLILTHSSYTWQKCVYQVHREFN
jgi:hypothetical protein